MDIATSQYVLYTGLKFWPVLYGAPLALEVVLAAGNIPERLWYFSVITIGNSRQQFGSVVP